MLSPPGLGPLIEAAANKPLSSDTQADMTSDWRCRAEASAARPPSGMQHQRGTQGGASLMHSVGGRCRAEASAARQPAGRSIRGARRESSLRQKPQCGERCRAKAFAARPPAERSKQGGLGGAVNSTQATVWGGC